MGGAKLLKWRLAAEGAKLLKSGAALILSIPRWCAGPGAGTVVPQVACEGPSSGVFLSSDILNYSE